MEVTLHTRIWIAVWPVVWSLMSGFAFAVTVQSIIQILKSSSDPNAHLVECTLSAAILILIVTAPWIRIEHKE